MPRQVTDPNRARRNKVPVRELPAGGFAGPYPEPPDWAKIPKRSNARKMWDWLWRLPEAAFWSEGDSATLVELIELQLLPVEERARVLAEVRQRQDRMGLSPAAKLQMHLTIVADEPVADAGTDEVAERREARRQRLDSDAGSTADASG